MGTALLDHGVGVGMDVVGCLSCERDFSGPWTSYVNRMESVSSQKCGRLKKGVEKGNKLGEMTKTITKQKQKNSSTKQREVPTRG